MTHPDPARLYSVIEATWPAKSTTWLGQWCIRDGAKGGKRVSAASLEKENGSFDIANAQKAMRNLNQPALFMIRNNDAALDRYLADQAYNVIDPSVLYSADVETLTATPVPPVTAFCIWEPLAVQKEIWAEGGIGPGRLAVMDRAKGPKTALLGRSSGRAAGTGFVAMDGDIAMIHALETKVAFRRQGLAAHLTCQAAHWAKQQGARYITLVTTRANEAANALYTGLGFQLVGHYHYRIHPEDRA